MSRYISNYLESTWSLGMSQYISSYLVSTWRSIDLIKQANTVLLRFNFADSMLKTCLFQSYCLSFYHGALWHLSSGKLKLLKSLTITVCIKFGHFPMYYILLLFIWLLSLRVCIICCIIDI